MKHNNSSLSSPDKLLSLGAALVVSALLAVPNSGLAQVITMTSGNSSSSVNVGSSAGMFDWTVDGINHLNQQWFWGRVGGGLAAPINSLGTESHTWNGSDLLEVTYANASYSIGILYLLTGGSVGSGVSDIIESIMVTNHTGSSLDFHLFQYSDFNLAGTAGGDSVDIFFSGSGYDFVSQTKGTTEIQEAITLPEADGAEAALYDATLVNLNTVPGYNLNGTLTAGPGDATWSLQWDASIGAGASFEVFKDKALHVTPVPEPSAMALFALALGAWGLARRRQ